MVQLLAGNLSSGDRSSMLKLVGVLSTSALHFALMLSGCASFCCCFSLKTNSKVVLGFPVGAVTESYSSS